MKRLHVNMSVDDLDTSIGFYTSLFATEPTVQKEDYAKWMLDDPSVNFAIKGASIAPVFFTTMTFRRRWLSRHVKKLKIRGF